MAPATDGKRHNVHPAIRITCEGVLVGDDSLELNEVMLGVQIRAHLRKKLDELDISGYQLAKMSGVDPSTITKFLNRSRPTIGLEVFVKLHRNPPHLDLNAMVDVEIEKWIHPGDRELFLSAKKTAPPPPKPSEPPQTPRAVKAGGKNR